MDEEIEQRLQEVADDAGESIDWAKEQYEEKMAKYQDVLETDIGEDRLPEVVIGSIRSDINKNVRVSGETEELPILSLGHGGERPIGGGNTGVIAVGIVNPQTGGIINEPPEDDPAGLAVFVCDESRGADLGNIRDAFRPLNTLKGWFSRRQASTVEWKGTDPEGNKRPVYICSTTGETRVEDTEVEALPSDQETKRKLINQQYIPEEDSFTLETFHENLSKLDGDRTADWGSDIKRMRGYIVDAYRNFGDPSDPDDNDFGVMTVIDDSVADVSELEDTDLSTGREGSAIGLTVWMPPELVQYGEESYVDVYGTLTRNQDGEVWMNGVSVTPLAAFPYEDDSRDEGGAEAGNETSSENLTSKSI